jgi:hypothetical protein
VQKSRQQQASADYGKSRERIAPQLAGAAPCLRAGHFGQVRTLAHRIAAELAEIAGPVIRVLLGLPGQGLANPADVTPHRIQLRFQAIRGRLMQAELGQKSVERHGSLHLCRSTNYWPWQFRALDLLHLIAILDPMEGRE